MPCKQAFILSALILALLAVFLVPSASADGYLIRNGQKIFASGVNLAWDQYAHDFADRYAASSLAYFTTTFKNIKAAGGNFARLWLHTNGVDTPAFSNKLVTGMGANRIDRIKKILDAAQANGVLVELALWSFDLLDPTQWEMTQTNIDQNNALLRDAKARKAYIDNALVPMVKALKGHPGLFGYDIFNEPEGIVDGWTLSKCATANVKCPAKFSAQEVRVFVNQFAGAIRSIDDQVFITVGSGVVKHSTHGWYTDDALIAAGGDKNGTLTHHSLHYYPYGNSENPFDYPASYWGVDKPVFVGEFPGIGFNQNAATQAECSKTYKLKPSQYKSSAQCYESAYNNGYTGLAGWQYKSTSGCNKKFLGDWQDMQAGVSALKGKSCISLTDSSCKVSSDSNYDGSTCPSTAKSLQTDSSKWVYRNGWGLGDGSTLTNSASSLAIGTKKWGRDFFWLIHTGQKMCLQKGKKYTVKVSFSEDASNTISGSAKCSSTNGCKGATVKSMSVSLIQKFETNVVTLPDGVDPDETIGVTGSSDGTQIIFSNDDSSPSSVPATISQTISFEKNSFGVLFGLKVSLFGKPSAANKYTLQSLSIEEVTEASSCGSVSSFKPLNAADWVLRNGWGFGDGSTLAPQGSTLTVKTRQWSRDFAWIVLSQKMCFKKGDKYTVSLNLTEDALNKVLCSSSNGCPGKTIQGASVSLLKQFSSSAYSVDGVDLSQLVPTSASADGIEALNISGSKLSKTFTVAQDAEGAVLAIKVSLLGKASQVNKYTLGAVEMTKN